jgi:hypothetical protein
MRFGGTSSLPAQLSQPDGNTLPARADAWIANSAILGERALVAQGADTNAGVVALEDQFVAGADTQQFPHFQRNRNLPLARNPRLLLHEKAPIPYFTMLSLPLDS